MNNKYNTNEIEKYFSTNRIKWDQFYSSEKKIIEKLNITKDTTILDVGCGCGGLGLALKEQFSNINYTGVEINDKAAKTAMKMNNEAVFYNGDILHLTTTELKNKTYDLVFSLSCIDWNIEFEKNLNSIWQHVKPGGKLMATFRITEKETINDIKRSYQFINYDNIKEGEIATYVVININDLLQALKNLNPLSINAYGYWGKPSLTAVTPFDELCFTALYIEKRTTESNNLKITEKLELPLEIINSINNV